MRECELSHIMLDAFRGSRPRRRLQKLNDFEHPKQRIVDVAQFGLHRFLFLLKHMLVDRLMFREVAHGTFQPLALFVHSLNLFLDQFSELRDFFPRNRLFGYRLYLLHHRFRELGLFRQLCIELLVL